MPNRIITGVYPAVNPSGKVSDTKSMSFAGSASVANTTPTSFGIVNSWSVTVACKTSTIAGNQTIFNFDQDDPDNDNNRISIRFVTSTIRLTIVDENGSGTAAKIYDYASEIVADTWYVFVVTWNGTTLTLYKDASALTPSTLVLDESVTQTEEITARLQIGADDVGGDDMTGVVHSFGMWDSVLTASEVTEIYNSGNISQVYLLENVGNYTSSADLLHWYRFGLIPTNIGKDVGLSTSLVDLAGAPTLVTDYPGI